MLMSNWRWPMSVFLALAVSPAGHAFAQGAGAPTNPALQECARAYENSQEHRGAGAIFAARFEYERCRRDDCPAFIRNDCSRWSKEVEAQQPSVIFSAKRGTRELTDVRVSTEERVLVERLSDRAVELDPGEYDFRFETPDGGRVVLHAVIQAGNKDRLVQVEFPPAVQAHNAARQSAGSPKATARAEPAAKQAAATPASGPRVLPWVFLAVGAASLGAGAGLSVWGRNEELQLRETCAPNCTDSEVQPVHTKYLLSNISFGVGLVSLSAAAYLFLRHPDSERVAERTLPVTVVAGPSSVQATYGARF
jgi:hypothetical protein